MCQRFSSSDSSHFEKKSTKVDFSLKKVIPESSRLNNNKSEIIQKQKDFIPQNVENQKIEKSVNAELLRNNGGRHLSEQANFGSHRPGRKTNIRTERSVRTLILAFEASGKQ